MRILHTGDLHIGSFAGPERQGRNVRFDVMCGLLDEIVAQARARDVDLAVIPGDLWHQAKTWSDRGLREQAVVAEFVRKLAEQCPVAVMRGTPNHDSMEQFNSLALAADRPGFSKYQVSVITEPGCGMYYARNGEMVSIVALPGYDREVYEEQMSAPAPVVIAEPESVTATRMINGLAEAYAARCVPAMPNGQKIPKILLGHFTIQGCNMESGQTAFFSETEVVMGPDTLRRAGYDLVCFNHIHRPQQIKPLPAFYSGAIAQLNFNDEGQARGFYVHELVGGNYAGSEFVALDSPEFFTMHLSDDAIGRVINGEDILAGVDLSNRIVRVRYNCTEAHQKELKHAALEKLLYAHDAFWVAEIAPISISMTMSGLAMNKSMTPEDALTDWLLQAKYTPAETQELVNLAKPFFDTQAATSQASQYSGLFLPISISVENYRNYRHESFDFTNVRCCTINGQNGVGKSSLFMDAIVDCIYEQPREGELTGWITNDPAAKTGKIEFVFMLGDNKFKINRTRSKAGKTTLAFYIWSEDKNQWTSIGCQKARDTQGEKIIRTIGMDCQTFKSCALIMQDQYGLFLCADKAARMSILGSILGLGTYDDLEGMAEEARLASSRLAKNLDEQIQVARAALPDMDQLVEDIRKTEVLVSEFADEVSRNTDAVATHKSLVDAAEQANGRMAELAVQKMQVDEDIMAARKRAESAQNEIDGLSGLISRAETIRADAEKHRAVSIRVGELKQALAGRDAIARQADLTLEDIGRCDFETDSLHQSIEAVKADLADKSKALAQYDPDELNKQAEAANALKVKLADMGGAGMKAYSNRKAEIEDVTALLGSEERALGGRVSVLEQEVKGLTEQAALLDTDLPCARGGADAEHVDCQFLAAAQRAKARLGEANRELEDARRKLDDRVRELTAKLGVLKSGFDEKFPEKYAAAQAEYDEASACLAKLQEYRQLDVAVQFGRSKLAGLESDVKAQNDRRNELAARYASLQKDLAGFDGLQKEHDAVARELEGLGDAPGREQELALAEVKLANARESLERERELVTRYEGDLTGLIAQINRCKSQAAGLSSLKSELAELEHVLKTSQTGRDEHSELLGGLRQTKAQADAQLASIAGLEKKRVAALLDVDKYVVLRQAFSQEGIRHNIIKSVIPALEATASGILSQMSNGRMSVELVTERQLKSNSKKSVVTLDVIINDSVTGRLPYMSRSGGERVKASLSVILALAETKGSQAGIQLGFLGIDEPPYLDGSGTDAYCDALDAIQRRYPDMKIMAISHDENMKSRFPQSVTVVKTANGSHVEY